jgi:hypothetical protein
LAERRVAYMVLGSKPGGKSPLEKLGVYGKIKLKTKLQEIGWGYELD